MSWCAPSARVAARSRHPAAPRRRIAARRSGIAYDDVPAGLRAIEPGDFAYDNVRATYMRGGAPGIVLQPDSAAQVADAIAFARRHPDAALSVRSGGHGISGRSTNDGGIVIDLQNLNAIEVLDEERRLVRIGPGARWAEVAAALGEHGWAISSGDSGGVGVGGLATAGGIGFLAREHGLTIDHLRAAELVLADGSIVRTDAETRPDLFWAVRGAGSNIGIVTAFEFEAAEVGDLGWAQLVFQVDDTAAFLEGFGAIVEAAPRDLTAFLTMGGRRGNGRRSRADLGDGGLRRPRHDHRSAAAVRRARPARAAVGAGHDLPARARERRPRSAQRHRRAALALGARHAPHARDRRGGGADAGRRRLLLLPGAVGRRRGRRCRRRRDRVRPSRGELLDRRDRGECRRVWTRSWRGIAAHAQGSYLSFDSSLRPERIGEAFPPETLARLRAIKAEVDPEGVFVDNFSVATD